MAELFMRYVPCDLLMGEPRCTISTINSRPIHNFMQKRGNRASR